MLERQERVIIRLAISISVIILIAVVIWRMTIYKPVSKVQTNYHQHSQLPSEPIAENVDKSAKTDIEPAPSLNDVIKTARTWGPAYQSWYGKTAPDFTLNDIAGKQHKLSDYRGRDTILIFWATWCGPCLMEIPHLIALRNTVGEGKLAILAISNENSALVKRFVADRKINYTVFSDARTMPMPFSLVNSIPSSFFINPEGKIKLATVGTLSLGKIKAILRAE